MMYLYTHKQLGLDGAWTSIQTQTDLWWTQSLHLQVQSKPIAFSFNLLTQVSVGQHPGSF